GTDPRRAIEALERIETAGLQALAAMDRAVHMLHGPDPAATPLPGLAELPDLLARFAAAGPVRADLELDPTLVRVVSRELGTTVYRVVTEALANVRRPAPTAPPVRAEVPRTRGPAPAG